MLHRNNSSLIYLLILTLSILSTGCTGAEESGATDTNQKQLKSFLMRYEKTFNPSRYDVDVNYLKRIEREHHIPLETKNVFTTSVPETVAGYRTQVLFTNNIDIANSAKDTLESLLPDYWCYIVYDAPYYKVRVGNFLDRNDASQLVHDLLRLGYKDTWVVPDNIIINIPPNPPTVEIEPDRSLPTPR